MTDLTLPTQGLSLLHKPVKSTHQQQQSSAPVIQLCLLENTTKDILRLFQNNEAVRLRLGQKPTLQLGKQQSLALDHKHDLFPSDLFVGPLDGTRAMYFSGKFSHALEMRKAQQDTAGADEALTNLSNTMKSLKESQAEASIRGEDDGHKKGLGLLGTRDRFLDTSRPSSPYLGGRSPGLAPTSAPLPSPATTKDRVRQDAIRVPLIHLLAAKSMTEQDIIRALRITKDDIERVVDKVTNEVGGKRELKAKFYKDLDVWKFPYPSPDDRQSAIDKAIHAYDKQRLDKHDPVWQLLLPQQDRGKGMVLSRLNFDKPLSVPKPLPKVDVKGDLSDREGKGKKAMKAVAEKTAHVRRVSQDIGTQSKPLKTMADKPTARSSKAEAKFKSSERIEDSDEEAQASTVIPARPASSLVRSKPLPNPVGKSLSSSTLAHAQPHKSKPHDSSSTQHSSDRSRPLADKHVAKPKPKPQTKAQAQAQAQADRPHPVSRPRNDSSPRKRSPLGSSPPNNLTDPENSSKASSHSSAPSSPPSSTDIPLAQTRRYSPVISGHRRAISASSIKRKGDRNDEQPPAKRQQLGGDHVGSLPKGLTGQLNQPTPERMSSASSASSPEKSLLTKQTVIAAAKRFTQSYGKYRDLHEKLSRQATKDRDDTDIEHLWNMHKRLDEQKAGIWADWAKVGGKVD